MYMNIYLSTGGTAKRPLLHASPQNVYPKVFLKYILIIILRVSANTLHWDSRFLNGIVYETSTNSQNN